MPLAMNPAPTIPTLIGVPAPFTPRGAPGDEERGCLPRSGGRDEPALAHKIRPAAVLFGDDGGLGGPLDAKRRIVPAHTPLSGRRVELRHEIGDLRLVREGQKGVRAAFRDEEHAVVLRTKLDRYVTHEGWRVRPQIEHHVVHSAANAAQKLVLLIRGDLVVEAAHRVRAAVEGGIHLDDPVGEAAIVALRTAPAAGKEAAAVRSLVKFYRIGALDFGGLKNHRILRDRPPPAG